MSSMADFSRVTDVSSKIWSGEGDLYSPLLQGSKISFDSLTAPSRAAFDRGTPVASTSINFNVSLSLHDPFEDLPTRLASASISQDSEIVDDGNGHRLGAKTTLPHWAISKEGQVQLTLTSIVHKGMLEKFARDRLGCQHLQSLYPSASLEERTLIAREVLGNTSLFQSLACDVFGNFFVQQLIEIATPMELEMVATRMKPQMFLYCINRYSCRVVQKALEYLPSDLKLSLVRKLHHTDIVRLCVDQNGNHVIQKIMNCFPLTEWAFLLESFLTIDENLFKTAEDKYGCRIVQLAVERLAAMQSGYHRDHLLELMMRIIVRNCYRLTLNEYSNYVIQFIIGSQPLAHYRDRIIENCLLKNILSMAQEKYASHVIEKAMEYAPPRLLKEMMDEIFDGYVPHPETRRDALDIIMFHQYGNYIVQRMLSIGIQAANAKSSGFVFPDVEARLTWLRRLSQKIGDNEGKLLRYSSGKKIMDMLGQIPLSLRLPAAAVAPVPHSLLPEIQDTPFLPPFDFSKFFNC